MTKRYYFLNSKVTIGIFCFSITSDGKVYLVQNDGSFRNIEHIQTRRGILICMPDGNTGRVWVEDKKVMSEIIPKKENADVKSDN